MAITIDDKPWYVALAVGLFRLGQELYSTAVGVLAALMSVLLRAP